MQLLGCSLQATGISGVSNQVSGGVEDTEAPDLAKILAQGQIAEEFFRETASQLTYYGLSRLHEEVC